MSVSFPRLGKSSAVISSSEFSASFPLSSPFGPYNVNARMLHVISEVSHTTLTFKNSFFCSAWVISTTLLIHSTVLSNLFDSRFLQMYFLFHILYSSALFGSSLYFLTSC